MKRRPCKLLLDLLHYMGEDQEHNLSTEEDRANLIDDVNKYFAQIVTNRRTFVIQYLK